MFRGAMVFGLAMGLAAPAFAGPTYTFNLDQSGVANRPSSAGTVTITQDGSAVDVLFVPTAGWGILNTGGPHTPFAFNIGSPPGNAGLQIAWTTPVGGVGTKGTFTLNTGGGSNTPFGAYNTALDYSAGNGSGDGYFGNLDFKLSLSSGSLSTTDFAANTGGYFFSADTTDGSGNTGASAANVRNSVPTPEPSGLAILGTALVGLGLLRSHRRA